MITLIPSVPICPRRWLQRKPNRKKHIRHVSRSRLVAGYLYFHTMGCSLRHKRTYKKIRLAPPAHPTTDQLYQYYQLLCCNLPMIEHPPSLILAAFVRQTRESLALLHLYPYVSAHWKKSRSTRCWKYSLARTSGGPLEHCQADGLGPSESCR